MTDLGLQMTALRMRDASVRKLFGAKMVRLDLPLPRPINLFSPLFDPLELL